MNRRALHYYEFGPFRLNVTEHLLQRGDELVPLTPKVIDTLRVLVENTGHVVEKSALMQELWPDSFVEESSLTQNISLLRRALNEGNGESQYIETIPKRGYRFVADVREVGEPAENTNGQDEERGRRGDTETEGTDFLQNALTSSNGSSVRHSEVALQSSTNTKSKLAFFAVLACAAIALVVAGVYWVRHHKSKSADFMPKSIAVLPFQTIGSQPESEMLGLGMADALIIKLNQLDQLTVLPTSAIFRFNTRDKDVIAIGKDLGVEGVLDGTVQRDGDSVRVTAQLIRLSDGKTVWSAKFDERYRSLFVLQDSISEQVSQSLRPQMTAGKRPASPAMTSNTDAYQDYVTGIYFWNRRTRENLPKAIQYLESAIKKDPNFAKAHAVLADCHYLSLTDEYRSTSPEESLRRADEAVRRALELDDTLAEAHTTKAGLLLVYRNVADAAKEFQRALDLNPNYATAHLRYSYFLYGGLQLDAAVNHMKRAQELDPVSAVTNAALSGMLYSARDYDGAISAARRAIELEPNTFGAHLNMGDAYIQKRMFTEAHQAFDTVMRQNPRYVHWEKAYAYAFAGRRDESLRMIAELESQKLEETRNHYNYALIYGAMGDIDKAFYELDQVKWGRLMLAQLKFDPQFDPLRNDPRFRDLLKRLQVE